MKKLFLVLPELPEKYAFLKSKWLFPVVLTLVLGVLTLCKINGSSIGVYQPYLNGTTADSKLLANEPRLVRSDEWRVNSQMIIAQKNNHYNRINDNIGNGQDMSVIHDVPYKEWSAVFRPQNLAFFVLPFDNAFAFKWWVMSYLVILSCYFFVLAILPKKILFSALLSLSLFFSAFVQWWYAYGTLGCIYYGLFISTVFIYLVRSRSRWKTASLGALLTYLLVSFALILYPPFQIPTVLAVIALCTGYGFTQISKLKKPELLFKVGVLGSAFVVTLALLMLFIATRTSAINAIQNSSYPGTRIVKSGGFNLPHLLSPQLGYQFRSETKSAGYVPTWFNNQSEASNFLLFLPFFFLPTAYLLYKDRQRGRPTDWPLWLINGLYILFLAWLFVPHLTLLGKVSLLNKVPLTRVIIGLGLLNIFQLVCFAKRTIDNPQEAFKKKTVLWYVGLIFVAQLLLGFYALHKYAGFIGVYRVVAFSIPMPVILYLFLRKRFEWAMLGLLTFSIFMSYWINPLYVGTSIVTETKISKDIQQLASQKPGKWVIEDSHLENFAMANGAQSLSGVYAYPQLDIWKGIDTNKKDYNRYAHTDFSFDRDAAATVASNIILDAPDHFRVNTEPCSAFLSKNDVWFIMTGTPLNSNDTCFTLAKKVTYPNLHVYIYERS